MYLNVMGKIVLIAFIQIINGISLYSNDQAKPADYFLIIISLIKNFISNTTIAESNVFFVPSIDVTP